MILRIGFLEISLSVQIRPRQAVADPRRVPGHPDRYVEALREEILRILRYEPPPRP